MLEQLTSYYTTFQELMKTNPVMAGVFSLWGLTVVTMILKTFPLTVYNFLKRQLITSVSFNNAATTGNEASFIGFMEWYSNTNYIKYSRMLSIESKDWGGHSVMGPGVGKHFFIYKRRLFWFNFNKLDSSGTNQEKREIIINTFGRSQKGIYSLFEEFKYKKDNGELAVYRNGEHGWKQVKRIRKRELKTTIIEKDIKETLLKEIDFLINNRSWFDDKGLPYKKTIVLHGIPGTGKTSIISALASHFNRNICIINISSVTNSKFEALMQEVPPNSFVIIEDFDTVGSTKKRKSKVKKITKSKNNPSDEILEETPAVQEEDEEPFSLLNLTTILNSLDGIIRLDDVVVFLTTNHIEKIDPAILRKGRVDHTYEIKKFKHVEVLEYIQLMYPDQTIPCYTFADIAGCDIQSLFMDHKDNFKEFILALPKIEEE